MITFIVVFKREYFLDISLGIMRCGANILFVHFFVTCEAFTYRHFFSNNILKIYFAMEEIISRLILIPIISLPI